MRPHAPEAAGIGMRQEGFSLSVPRRPLTYLLLLAFVVGEVMFHRAGWVRPVAAPLSPPLWRLLAPGSYTALAGFLVPETGTGTVLYIERESVVPLQPERFAAVGTTDRVLTWSGGRLALVVQEGRYVRVQHWQGRWVFADAAASNLWAVDPGNLSLRPLLPDRVGGVTREELAARYPGWRVLWALAPLPLSDGSLLYLSNRSTPGSETLSLWQWDPRGTREVLNGTPLHSVWPLGASGDLVYLADGQGDILTFQARQGTYRVVAAGVEPVAFEAHAGVLVAGLRAPGSAAVVSAARTSPLILPTGLAFAGLGAFAPGGQSLALYARGRVGTELVVAQRRDERWEVGAPVGLPAGWSLDAEATPSWIDADTLVVTLRKERSAATFAYRLPGG